ncbi:hypothetical protein ACQRIU_005200 [Beauveria bassiana]
MRSIQQPQYLCAISRRNIRLSLNRLQPPPRIQLLAFPGPQLCRPVGHAHAQHPDPLPGQLRAVAIAASRYLCEAQHPVAFSAAPGAPYRSTSSLMWLVVDQWMPALAASA